MRISISRTHALLVLGFFVWRAFASDSLLAALAQTVPFLVLALVLPTASREPRSSEQVDGDGSAEEPCLERAEPQHDTGSSAETDTVAVLADERSREAARRLLQKCSSFCDAVGVHMWLHERDSSSVRRLVTAGTFIQPDTKLPLDDEPVGLTASDGRQRMSPIAVLRTPASMSRLWRFAQAFPLDHGRLVVGIDIRSEGEPESEPLVSAVDDSRDAILDAFALHPVSEVVASTKMLLEAAEVLGGKLRKSEIAEEALRLAMRLCGAESGSVMLVDERDGAMRIAAASGLNEQVVSEAQVREGEGIAGWVLMTRQPTLVEDQDNSSRVADRGKRSAICVPITDSIGPLGVINVSVPLYPSGFGRGELETLGVLGSQVAAALRNAQALSSARDLYVAALRALMVALETKDPYARGATERVLGYALSLADEMRLEEAERESLRIAALLHDIGMAPTWQATDPSAEFSTREQELMEMHPTVAAEMLREVPLLRRAIPMIYHHHEWFDGRGYVAGLAGDAIPVGARVLAVVDAFVAMTSDRPYRIKMSPEEALRELRVKSGTQFDPEVVEAFTRLLAKEGEPYGRRA